MHSFHGASCLSPAVSAEFPNVGGGVGDIQRSHPGDTSEGAVVGQDVLHYNNYVLLLPTTAV